MIRLILALMLLATPAEAHCFSIWRYPFPQNCRIHMGPNIVPTPPARPVREIKIETAPRFPEKPETISLPALDATWDKSPDDETVGRLLLRGKLLLLEEAQ